MRSEEKRQKDKLGEEKMIEKRITKREWKIRKEKKEGDTRTEIRQE